MNKKKINEIFARFAEKNPDPKIELEYGNPYELLVAVVLSAQATDKGVNRITPNLFAVANSPEEMLKLGEEGLKKFIKTIGLFNSKAKNIIKLSQQLIDSHNGLVPRDFQALIKLSGVGRKSASVVLNSLFKDPFIAVDTHVFRVSNRIGLCNESNVLATEKALLKNITKNYLEYASHWLVLHGRYTCKARKPNCSQCIINDLCEYKNKVM